MSERGRPTKLTLEAQQRIVAAISAGNHLTTAAALGGVDYTTMRGWMNRGRAAKSGLYFDFYNAVMKAEAAAEVTLVAQWKQQAATNWQASRDMLARRWPERWAETHKVQQLVDAELDHALELLANSLPEAEYTRILEVLAAGGVGGGAAGESG